MAATLKDTKGLVYKLNYKIKNGETHWFEIEAGKKGKKDLECSQLITGMVVDKAGQKYYAVFEFQKQTAIAVYALLSNKIEQVKHPENIEKFKIDCSIKKLNEDLYISDIYESEKISFMKDRAYFVNYNTQS